MQNHFSMKSAKIYFLSGLTLAVCLLSLSACRHSPNQSSPNDAAGPRIRWAFTAGSSPLSGIALSPNGNIHFAADDGIYALSSAGLLLWKAPLPSGPVIAAPTLAPNGTLYAASESGKLFALDTAGTLIWQSESTQHKFFTPPALGTGGALYVTDDYTNLFAFSPTMGSNVIWKQMTYSATGSKDDILLGHNTSYGVAEWRSSPVIGSDDMIYLAHQQWLYRLNQNGDILWFVQLLSAQLGFPAIGGDGMVYVEGHNPVLLFAIVHDGKQRWAVRLSNRLQGSPVVDKSGTIYFCDSDFVKAILPDSQSKWFTKADCNSGPALAADGTLYLGMNLREPGKTPRTSFLAAFTPDGQLKWKIEIQGSVREAPAIAPDGTIFFTTDKGFAYAISGASSPPMDSPWPRFQHDAQNSGRTPF
jgi:outer membrane protein assembly factor BamB